MILKIEENAYDNVPAGTYKSTFRGIEQKVLSSQYSENGQENNYVWNFELEDGRAVVAFSNAEKPPTPKNKTGRYIASLVGKVASQAVGEGIDPEAYIGQPYQVMVNERGKVEQFTKL